MLYLLALLIGVVAGLRAMTAPAAAVAWGAWLGWLPLAGTWAKLLWVTGSQSYTFKSSNLPRVARGFLIGRPS